MDTMSSKKNSLLNRRSEAIRNRPPTKNQLRNQMMTYLKHVGNFKHAELKIKKFEEVQALYEKIKSKEEVQKESKEEESTRKRKLGTRKKMKSRKRRYIQNTSEDDSDKENDELRLHLTIAPDEEKEVDLKILDRKYLSKNERQNDENEFWNSQQDWNIVSWKLHGSSGVHTLVTETGLVIHMLVEKKYPLRKEVLMQMLKLKLESEEDSTMALELIRVLNSPCFMVKSWLVHDQTVHALASPKANELTIPEQTATGKGTSNPLMAEINANFELKHGLINLVQNKQFFGHDKEDPHAHIRYFNKITSTMRFPDIPSTSIKLMLFPFSLEGSARIWLEKEPPRSILTWDDLVSKFINQFFPPSKTTNLRNEITRFQQRFDESFYEAWDRFNDLLRACPHHGFSELHQLDTFYNALNANDQDSLNSAAGGNFLDKMPRECLRIIESKSKVRNSRNKAVVAKVSSNSSTPGISPDVAALTTEVSELKNMMKTMLIDKQKAQAPAPVKAVEQSCVTCGGAHSYKNCPATDGNVYRDNIQEYVSQAAAANFNQGNTNSRPPMVSNQIRPPGFPPIQNNQNRFNQNQGNNFNQNRGTNFNQNRGSNFNQGQVYQPPTNQPPVYQAPTPQMQGVSKTDFENYVKANDAVLRNMQNQGQGLQNQMTNLTKMLSKFITSNTASSSNSGTLPSQTVTNPREHVNAITTRSGKTCEGPSTPLVPTPVVSTPLKKPEQNPETSMDKVQKPSSENTAQVPPPEDHDSIFIEIPKPKAKKTVQEPNSPEPNSYQPKLREMMRGTVRMLMNKKRNSTKSSKI
ncbi:reverse transcriptase domain-containing protein [Tanacetum coccineum]